MYRLHDFIHANLGVIAAFLAGFYIGALLV